MQITLTRSFLELSTKTDELWLYHDKKKKNSQTTMRSYKIMFYVFEYSTGLLNQIIITPRRSKTDISITRSATVHYSARRINHKKIPTHKNVDDV